MQLNKKSWYVIYYKWFYTTESLPYNLCPFFWKLVVALLLSPLDLLAIPCLLLLLRRIKKDRKVYTEYTAYSNSFDYQMDVNGHEYKPRHFIGFAVYFFLCAFYCSIAMWFTTSTFIFTTGVIFIGALTMAGFAILVTACVDYRKNRIVDYNADKKKYIITEFVKAKYNKYCPQITWK